MLDKVQVCEIGMPRTATRSLTEAMKILGYKSSHGFGFCKISNKKYDNQIYGDCITRILKGDVNLYPYNHYEFVSNFPSIHWKQLAETKPDLKFILTIRDIESWWNSCFLRWKESRNYQTEMIIRKQCVGKVRIISMGMRFKWFGCYDLNEFCWKDGFKKHNDEVMKYFEGTKRLLVHDVFNGDGWKTLCEFLDKDIPNEKYPKTTSLFVTSKLENK